MDMENDDVINFAKEKSNPKSATIGLVRLRLLRIIINHCTQIGCVSIKFLTYCLAALRGLYRCIVGQTVPVHIANPYTFTKNDEKMSPTTTIRRTLDSNVVEYDTHTQKFVKKIVAGNFNGSHINWLNFFKRNNL